MDKLWKMCVTFGKTGFEELVIHRVGSGKTEVFNTEQIWEIPKKIRLSVKKSG